MSREDDIRRLFQLVESAPDVHTLATEARREIDALKPWSDEENERLIDVWGKALARIKSKAEACLERNIDRRDRTSNHREVRQLLAERDRLADLVNRIDNEEFRASGRTPKP